MKNISIIVCAAAMITAASCAADSASIVSRPEQRQSAGNYVNNRPPLLPAQWIKLPSGSIQAGGWLREILCRQRGGLAGHLGEISAWLDKSNNAWLDPQGRGTNGWEEVPYWLKGYSALAYALGDTAMLRETQIWIDAALASQDQDGRFGPLILKGGRPDLWGNMIMLWCLQGWYEYTQDERVLPFMTRYFHWQDALPDHLLLSDYWENSRGGDNLISIYWLYNLTGDKFLLNLAHKIHRNTADWCKTNDLPNWHNVNIAQGFREPAEYYLQTHSEERLRASYNNFNFIRQLYGQASGGMFGADENARAGYADPRQAVELCGMVEQMASDYIMLRITGDPFWADNCEDIAFNTCPAAFMPDMRALRYLTAPNMVVSDSKNHSPGIDNSGPFLLMNPFSSRCCQHNHTQGYPYYAENLYQASPDGGLLAALYCESSVKAKVGDGKEVVLEQNTRYPFGDTIYMVIKEGDARFPLYLRIPQWCSDAGVRVANQSGTILTMTSPADPRKSAAGKYMRIERNWLTGDSIILVLPARLRLRKWEQNGNSVSVNYGALSFSLKIDEQYVEQSSISTAIGDSRWQSTAKPQDWKTYEILPASAWNYALLVDEDKVQESFEVVRRPYPADNFPFTPQAAPIMLRAKGRILPQWTLDEYGLCGLLPRSPAPASEPIEDITLIPMGAARLRISSFPTAEK